MEKGHEYERAKDLALHLWAKFFKAEAPEWEPCDDLMGVLTQIDNMTTGLARQSEGHGSIMEDKEIIAKLDEIIRLLQALTHMQPAVYKGIDTKTGIRPDDFCTCGLKED